MLYLEVDSCACLCEVDVKKSELKTNITRNRIRYGILKHVALGRKKKKNAIT